MNSPILHPLSCFVFVYIMQVYWKRSTMARRKEHYQGGCVLGLSIIQVILGVACIVLQIVLIVNKSAYYFFVEGIWAGVIVSITLKFFVISTLI